MDETAKLCETPPPDYGKIKAALRGVESAVLVFTHCSMALLKTCSVVSKRKA